MEINYKQHLKNSNGMSMPDRLDNEFVSLGTFEKKAKRLCREKLGFWKCLNLILSGRWSNVYIHVAGDLFYGDKIYWENIDAW